VPDGGHDQADVALVESGDGVAQTHGMPACEACGDAKHALLPARGRQVAAVEGGDHGVPVDPGHRGAVAEARPGVDVTGEVVTTKVDAVADDEVGSGFARVQARAAESVTPDSSGVVSFEDPPGISGDGTPSGGKYQADGVMTFHQGGTGASSWLETCTLPDSDSAACKACSPGCSTRCPNPASATATRPPTPCPGRRATSTPPP